MERKDPDEIHFCLEAMMATAGVAYLNYTMLLDFFGEQISNRRRSSQENFPKHR